MHLDESIEEKALLLENKGNSPSAAVKKDSPPKIVPTTSKAIRNTIDIVEIKEKITQAWSISAQVRFNYNFRVIARIFK